MKLTIAMLVCDVYFVFNKGSKVAKAAYFYRGIENIVEHWEEVVINNGEYITD